MEPNNSNSSILDTLGLELISVISPVSISMLLVVLLISTTTPTSSSPPPPITAATLVYQESPADSATQKLSGALLNALVFVILIAAVTFLLVLLYYYNFTRLLKNYTRLSAFFVLASMGGSILLSLLRSLSLPLDALSSLLLLLNFSVIGVLSIFSDAVPILVKQSYAVLIAIIIAAWFTKLPEWTTWTLLMALSVYDLVAVLCPGGPLRMLVEMASSRDDDLPALVYEARPVWSSRPPPPPAAVLTTVVTDNVELQPLNSSSSGSPTVVEIDIAREERSPLMVVGSSSNDANPYSVENPPSHREGDDGPREINFETMEMTRGIRLGLGDFVFYSVLVGRAAMYDLMTVYACYLVIVSGLGCTLILLTVWRRALPALPISITLGVVFYFLTRLLMEPFVVGASTNLDNQTKEKIGGGKIANGLYYLDVPSPASVVVSTTCWHQRLRHPPSFHDETYAS